MLCSCSPRAQQSRRSRMVRFSIQLLVQDSYSQHYRVPLDSATAPLAAYGTATSPGSDDREEKIYGWWKQLVSRTWWLDQLTIGPHFQQLFVAGDIEAFFFSMLNNLLNIAVAYELFVTAAKFDAEWVKLNVIPGIGLSVLLGCLFYWRQARILSKERNLARQNDPSLPSGDDVTAQPFGISVPSLFAFVSFIILPAIDQRGAQEAFAITIFANFWSGVLEALTSLFGDLVLKHFPRPALLSVIAGTALALIAVDTLYQIFALPLTGLLPLLLFFLLIPPKVNLARTFFGLEIRLPAMAVVLFSGVLVAWLAKWAGSTDARFITVPHGSLGFFVPKPSVSYLAHGFRGGFEFLGIFLPLALLNGIGSLQVITSAQKAGDEYEMRSSLIFNGLSTVLSSLFGNPFPTSIYMGHPTMKRLGGRSGYLLLTGITIFVITTFGFLPWLMTWLPITALAPILVWIGVDMCAEGFFLGEAAAGRRPEMEERQNSHYFSSSPRYLVGVVVGLLPPLASLTVRAVTATISVTNSSWAETVPKFEKHAAFYFNGAVALSQGFLPSSMLWSATVIRWLDRKYLSSSVYLLILAGLSWIGLIHSFRITSHGIENLFVGQDGRWVAAGSFSFCYLLMSVLSLCLYIVRRSSSSSSASAHMEPVPLAED